MMARVAGEIGERPGRGCGKARGLRPSGRLEGSAAASSTTISGIVIHFMTLPAPLTPSPASSIPMASARPEGGSRDQLHEWSGVDEMSEPRG